MVTEEDAFEFMLELGLRSDYKSTLCAAYAIYLAAQDLTKLQLITKLIYPDVAAHFGMENCCAERNIRNAVRFVWQISPEHFCKIIGTSVSNRPTAGRFIDMCANYLIARDIEYQNSLKAERCIS